VDDCPPLPIFHSLALVATYNPDLVPVGRLVYPFSPVSQTTPSAPPAKPRNFWQRRIRDPIIAQLTQGITPEKIAVTIAVGSAFALFPMPVTTLLCFLVAWALRLNQPIIQLMNQALWPVHILTIIGCVRLGETMFGSPHVRLGEFLRMLSSLSSLHSLKLLFREPALWADQFSAYFHRFGLTIVYAIVAWAIITPFYIAIVYFIALPIAREVTFLKHKAELRPPTNPPIP